jgi:hypothetical protein
MLLEARISEEVLDANRRNEPCSRTMLGTWREQHLPQIVANLANRPGHESVRTLVAVILRYGSISIITRSTTRSDFPKSTAAPDTLFGSVVFEFKRDLRLEHDDVLARLPDYLSERERHTGRRFLRIATDGAAFIAYELRQGLLVEIGKHEWNPARPEALLAWLEPALRIGTICSQTR